MQSNRKVNLTLVCLSIAGCWSVGVSLGSLPSIASVLRSVDSSKFQVHKVLWMQAHIPSCDPVSAMTYLIVATRFYRVSITLPQFVWKKIQQEKPTARKTKTFQPEARAVKKGRLWKKRSNWGRNSFFTTVNDGNILLRTVVHVNFGACPCPQEHLFPKAGGLSRVPNFCVFRPVHHLRCFPNVK